MYTLSLVGLLSFSYILLLFCGHLCKGFLSLVCICTSLKLAYSMLCSNIACYFYYLLQLRILKLSLFFTKNSLTDKVLGKIHKVLYISVNLLAKHQPYKGLELLCLIYNCFGVYFPKVLMHFRIFTDWISYQELCLNKQVVRAIKSIYNYVFCCL